MFDFKPYNIHDKASDRRIRVPAPGVREYYEGGKLQARISSSKFADDEAIALAIVLPILIVVAGLSNFLLDHHGFHKAAHHATRAVYARPLQPVATPNPAKPVTPPPHPAV